MVNETEVFLCSTLNCSLVEYNVSNLVEEPEVPGEDLQYLHDQLATTRFIVQRVLTPLVVGFGVLGNIVNIVVLTRRWMKSSTNCYLTALAVADILYLVFALSMSFKHYPGIVNTPHFIRYRLPFGRPLVDTFSNTGVWLTLTFTMERYIGVCHPMKGKRWCTPQRARYIIAAVCVSAALITFPEFFEYAVVTVLDDHNQTKLVARPTEFGSRPSYSLGYNYINQGLFTLLPLVLLFVFNSLLIRAVLTAARQRQTMAKVAVVKAAGGAGRGAGQHRHHSDQQKITIMLIIVVIVFLLCQLPQAIQKLYVVYLQVSGNNTPAGSLRFKISANIFNLLVMINAACNFILYSCFSTKFRRTFRRLFCQCLGHRRSIPEILFTDMTTTNPSPPEESRAHLLRSSAGHKNHYTGHAQWSKSSTGAASTSGDNSTGGQCSRGPGSRSPGSKGGSSGSAKNGYLEVLQGGKSEGYTHHNSSAL